MTDAGDRKWRAAVADRAPHANFAPESDFYRRFTQPPCQPLPLHAISLAAGLPEGGVMEGKEKR
jgi:hypothetical protein